MEHRIEEGCWEWCGIDQAIHQVSFYFASGALLVWVIPAAVVLRTMRGVRGFGIAQMLLALLLLALNGFFMTFANGRAAVWWVSVATCILFLVHGAAMIGRGGRRAEPVPPPAKQAPARPPAQKLPERARGHRV